MRIGGLFVLFSLFACLYQLPYLYAQQDNHTLPYLITDQENISISAHYDLDRRCCYIRDIIGDMDYYSECNDECNNDDRWTFGRAYDQHTGTDYNTGDTHNIFAVASAPGEVIEFRNNCDCNRDSSQGYGNYVKVDHGEGVITVYGHLVFNSLTTLVLERQRVARGTPLGKIGTTGNSTGIHLHFEVRVNGNHVDPYSRDDIWMTDPPTFPAYIGYFANYSWSEEISPFFVKAYERNEGEEKIGVPYDDGDGVFIHDWWRPNQSIEPQSCFDPSSLCLQNFAGGTYGENAIFFNPRVRSISCNPEAEEDDFGCAFLVRTGFWAWYRLNNGVEQLGVPWMDEDEEQSQEECGIEASFQIFEKGTLLWRNGQIDVAYGMCTAPCAYYHLTVVSPEQINIECPPTRQECTPGDVETRLCNNCGEQSRTCNNNGSWGDWSSCSGEGQGLCCDSFGNYRPSSFICQEDAITEYGCPWGTNPGNDVGVRHRDRYCSGSSALCDGELRYDSWILFDDCGSNEICVPGEPACQTTQCTPGESENQSCGNCGTQTRICDQNGNWGPWGDCIGEGICSPGQTQSRSCGNCGTQIRRCVDTCQWGPWEACQEGGVCTPGQTQTENCANCGTRQRTCQVNCNWGAWGSCSCSTHPCCDPSSSCLYKPSSVKCALRIATDYGCPWGTSCGADVGVRYQDQYCSGNNATCNGQLEWGSWSIVDSCDTNEICVDNDSTCNMTQQCEPVAIELDPTLWYAGSPRSATNGCNSVVGWHYDATGELPYWTWVSNCGIPDVNNPTNYEGYYARWEIRVPRDGNYRIRAWQATGTCPTHTPENSSPEIHYILDIAGSNNNLLININHRATRGSWQTLWDSEYLRTGQTHYLYLYDDAWGGCACNGVGCPSQTIKVFADHVMIESN